MKSTFDTAGRTVVLSKGYGKKDRLTGVVQGFTIQRIDDPSHIFNQFFGDKAKDKLAAVIWIEVTR